MKLKVAYLFGSLNRGGTETLLLDVLRNSSQNELDVFGVYRKGGTLEKQFLSSGVDMFFIPLKRNLLFYLIQLRKLLLSNKISIAHAQQPLDALLAWVATLGTNIKVIQTLHGFDFNEKSISRMILTFIIKRTNINVFVSETQKDYYLKKYHLKPEKQVVVYNGLDFNKFLNITAKSLRKDLGIDSDTLLLGSVGNFNNVRNQLLICRALKLLSDSGEDFHFVFVGKRIPNVEYLYDDCVSYCESNQLSTMVSFLGVRENVPEILAQLDAFVYSTVHDTFGIAVIEAMASGIPVFINDWDVMSEITQNGKYATLYSTNNEFELFGKLKDFINDKLLFVNKSNNASDFVKDHLSIERHIQSLKKLYQNLAGF